MYLTGLDSSDTPAQAQAIIAKAVQMLQSVPTAYARIDVSPLAPTNSANNGTLILQVLAYAALTLPPDERAILRQDVVDTGLFDMALKIIGRGQQGQAAINAVSLGIAGGDLVALGSFVVVPAGTALARCAADISCRVYLYIEGTAAAEAFANPGSVPTISGLSAAASKVPVAAELAENLAKDFFALEPKLVATGEGWPLAGAGGNWPRIGEVADPIVPSQAGPMGCGGGCGSLLLAERGISATPTELGTAAQSVQELAATLNKVDSGWTGAGVDFTSTNIQALNGTGSWGAVLYDGPGAKMPHFVTVAGEDFAGNLLIHDPWPADGVKFGTGPGTTYSMTVNDFLKVWTGFSVYKK